MKGTIIDYLKEYADVSLKDEPMNDVDSLVRTMKNFMGMKDMKRRTGRFLKPCGNVCGSAI